MDEGKKYTIRQDKNECTHKMYLLTEGKMRENYLRWFGCAIDTNL